MQTQIKTSIALKLHAFGLAQLHDPNWTGMDLLDRLKQHTRGRQEPTSLLFKTLRRGLLYHVGLWLYDDYFIHDIHRMSLGGEYRLWYLEDLLELLGTVSVPTDHKLVAKAQSVVTRIDALYDESESKYLKAVDRNTTYELIDDLITKFDRQILSVAGHYAANYAERVFHDRQLCEHVSNTLVSIGFDGRNDWEGLARQWSSASETGPHGL